MLIFSPKITFFDEKNNFKKKTNIIKSVQKMFFYIY